VAAASAMAPIIVEIRFFTFLILEERRPSDGDEG
jgi:hypothetical protein